MTQYTMTTDEIRDACISWFGERGRNIFDRWLTTHDAATRTATLEEAGRDLLRGVGIQSTNGIGWTPTDSLQGAGRYLLHIAYAAKVAES